MNYFIKQVDSCHQVFEDLGDCYHLWTPENFELIFSSEDDYRCGMNIIGICAKMSPGIRILTFEIMSNHLHSVVAGREADVMEFFEHVKKYLSRHFKKAGKTVDWSGFNVKTRSLATLEDLRNVIIYDNRNGYLVCRNHTPFTYPWGANRYYFSPDSRALARMLSRPMTLRDRQKSTNSRKADEIQGLMMFEGCASPISFCDIETGEKLFQDASNYFYLMAKNIETNVKIAREIGESISYTDNELFSAIARICRGKYGVQSMSAAVPEIKLELARTMRYEYNASIKQIMRFLKLSHDTLSSIGIK